MTIWQYPFPKNTITSRYGDRGYPRTSPHRGVDFAPGAKDLIPAITDGVVTAIFYSGCLGWVCEFKSDDGGVYIGHSHLYCNKHNSIDCDGSDHEDGSTCMSKLKVGDRVKRGDWVGRIGNSGTCSRGAHLHLTFSKKPDPRYAKTFNPERFLDQKLAKQEREKSALRQTKKAKEIKVCKCCQRPL
jgi:murein DD-endopeptidase MepM/ murein hydrolase activator NlpD